MTHDEIKARAEQLGLNLTVEDPCDGRHYQFEKPDGTEIGYAVGNHEARLWLKGYTAGRKDDPK